jgi:hypothetical protein
VAFDELRCDTRTYRFGSVGEDNKLIVVRELVSLSDLFPLIAWWYQWDFSSGALHRPKLQVNLVKYMPNTR